MTLRDDPLESAEGRRPLRLRGRAEAPADAREPGVVRAVTYDSLTASKAGTQTTGHAMLGGELLRAGGSNLVLEPGDHSHDDLIRNIDKGC